MKFNKDRCVSIASVAFGIMTMTGWADLAQCIFAGISMGCFYMMATWDGWKDDEWEEYE